jgi:hypothetical protein
MMQHVCVLSIAVVCLASCSGENFPTAPAGISEAVPSTLTPSQPYGASGAFGTFDLTFDADPFSSRSAECEARVPL